MHFPLTISLVAYVVCEPWTYLSCGELSRIWLFHCPVRSLGSIGEHAGFAPLLDKDCCPPLLTMHDQFLRADHIVPRGPQMRNWVQGGREILPAHILY